MFLRPIQHLAVIEIFSLRVSQLDVSCASGERDALMKKMRIRIALSLIAMAAIVSAVGEARGQGDPVYNYSLNTSSLNPASTYYLYFQLNEGTTGLTPNSVTVDGFDFGGGAALDVPASLPPSGGNPIGGVSTDGNSSTAPTTLTLDDIANAFSALGVAFTPGSDLDFRVDASNKLVEEAVNTPDEFEFAILDKNGDNLATTAPDTTDNLIELTFGYPDGSPPVADYETYSLVGASAVPLPRGGGEALLLMVLLFGWLYRRKTAAGRIAHV
jgi:hypothetical protein